MTIQIVYETHSISVDNETNHASGWNHSLLYLSVDEGLPKNWARDAKTMALQRYLHPIC